MDDSTMPRFGADVTAFIEKSGMTKVELELLLGISESSKGKTLRRWELYGPPLAASLLMGYMNAYGFDLARRELDGLTSR